MSGDPEQEYFVDGMTEDLITDISKLSGLFVIARNTVFTYKGKAVKVAQVAEDLGVRYVLEGSVRRAGDQVRINAQLIDATTGGHLWAERYDGPLSDVFSLQDQVSRKIVSALAVELSPSEEASLVAKGTTNLAAYEAFLRGIRHSNFRMLYAIGESVSKAEQEFQTAIELDRNYADAYAGLGWASWLRYSRIDFGRVEYRTRAFELAKKSIEIRDNALAYRILSKQYIAPEAFPFSEMINESVPDPHALAVAELRKAVSMEPNNPDGLAELAYTLVFAGESREATELMEEAKRLNPDFPDWYHKPAGIAYFLSGDFERAVVEVTAWYEAEPVPNTSAVWLAVAHAQAGTLSKAQKVFDEWRSRRGAPVMYLQAFSYFPFKDSEDRERLFNGLRKLGVLDADA
jgi:TolB-like protein/Flp pilus assembly protein TadD